MLIFVDLDGVCCNFVKAALQRHGINHDKRHAFMSDWPAGEWSIAKILGISDQEFWAKINRDATFWRHLEEYPWFGELLSTSGGFGDVMFSTSPSCCPTSYAGKAEWLLDRQILPNKRAMLGSNKQFLSAPDRVLIDDSDVNCQKFEDYGGQAILFPQVWNANHAIDDRIGFVSSRLAEIASQL